MTMEDNSKATTEWFNTLKGENTRRSYSTNWKHFIQYCTVKDLPSNGSAILEDIKEKRLSNDNTVKFFWDSEIPKFFKWLQTEYKSERTKKPLPESTALTCVNVVRGFFSYHRYTLEIQKDKLPSSEKVSAVYTDHAFDIYQLRAMFQQGDLRERTILSCGINLWLRVGDFGKIPRDLIETAIKRESEISEAEKREADILEFEIISEKEKEPASCHLSKESIELLRDYLKTYPKNTEYLFDLGEEALTDLLRRLAEKSKITIAPDARIRWHCLRKFGITLMHGKVTEPVMKYMTGKHISKDLKTYIQNNRETYKAFKMLEPLISLTKSNGNGMTSTLAKQLDELKKETFKRILFQKLLEKVIPKETMAKALLELAKEYDIDIKKVEVEGKMVFIDEATDTALDIDKMIETLAEKIEQKELERILAENGNNH